MRQPNQTRLNVLAVGWAVSGLAACNERSANKAKLVETARDKTRATSRETKRDTAAAKDAIEMHRS